MIKVFLRFFLLLILCCMLVYAPEILSSVSAPYALSVSERTLLRIALQCDSATSGSLYKVISMYQKQHPHVHLRITHISEDSLTDAAPPYPDMMICPASFAQQLPAAFDRAAPLSPAHVGYISALSAASAPPSAAAEFAAYIYETLPSQKTPSEN